MKLSYIICIVLAMMLLPMASAAPPVLSTVQTGSLEIIAPTFDSIPQSGSFDFYWHVFNTTSLLTNVSTSCTYHLYSKFAEGEHIYTQNPVTKFTNDRDFEVSINGANFSTQGEYCDLIECNTSTQTGGLERCFIVTQNGYDFTIQKVYLYIIGLLFLVMLIFGTVYIIGSLPSKDAQDEAGSIVHVSQLKHLRSVLWVVVWGISLAIVFVVSNISLAYLDNAMLGNLFFAFYKIMFWMTIVCVPLYFIWILYKVFKDAEMKRLIERGVEMKGTP